jgi:hypothetical protein
VGDIVDIWLISLASRVAADGGPDLQGKAEVISTLRSPFLGNLPDELRYPFEL